MCTGAESSVSAYAEAGGGAFCGAEDHPGAEFQAKYL